jgi:transposase
MSACDALQKCVARRCKWRDAGKTQPCRRQLPRTSCHICAARSSGPKCALVMQHAATLGIELLFLPSYSPHLNLIERFWRFVRKECLYSKYYPKFDGFKQALTDCIQNAHTKHRDELENLLSWNFQSFEKVKISTV